MSIVREPRSRIADFRAYLSYSPRSLSESLSGRQPNALNAVRLVLAFAVIFSHSFPVGGYGSDPFFQLFRMQENLGGVAVIGFFLISGYLITKSAFTKDFVQYFWARALRIFPAFWAVLLVSVLVIGPAIWLLEGRSAESYFNGSQGSPFSYVVSNWDLTIRQWGIFDIFANTPYGKEVGSSVFNGSLWTLIYEWGSYIAIGVLVLFGAMRYAKAIIPMLLLLSLVAQALRLSGSGGHAALFPIFADGIMVNLFTAFLWGALLAVYADKVVVDDRLGIFAFVLTAYTLLFGGFGVVGFPAFAYFLFWVAVRVPDCIKRIGARHDYSYGIYLYGWPVQQVLVYLGLSRTDWGLGGYLLYCAAACFVAAICAVLSWHFLERPALSIKDWGPGKGLRYWKERIRDLSIRRSGE